MPTDIFPTSLSCFSCRNEGLQAIDGDDDMLTAMARELVENKGIGESADSVWRSVQRLRPSGPVYEEEEGGPIEHAEGEIPAILPSAVESIPQTALIEAASSSRASLRKAVESGQLSLF